MAAAGQLPAGASTASDPPASPSPRPLRVLDLFSGIGGMHHALLQVPLVRSGAVQLEVTAVDINTTANKIYAAEFGAQPRALDLQRITAAQLDALAADLWLLTPPCQPYTTGPNARRRDTADPRAGALLRLLCPEAGLPAMRRPPARVLLENVPGFVGSDSHRLLRGALDAAGYELQEFVVSPHQLGVPYSRPRYFALALRRPLRFAREYDSSAGPVPHPPIWESPPRQPAAAAAAVAASATQAPAQLPLERSGADHGRIPPGPGLSRSPMDDGITWGAGLRGPADPRPIAEAARWPGVYDAGPAPSSLGTGLEPGQGVEHPVHLTDPCYYYFPPQQLSAFLVSKVPPGAAAATLEGDHAPDDGDDGGCDIITPDQHPDPWVTYGVPAAQLARFWRVLDVVTPSSTYCNCFTKHYADNVLGAGSVLASEQFAERFCRRDDRGRLHFAAPPPLPLPLPLPLLGGHGGAAAAVRARGSSGAAEGPGKGTGEESLPGEPPSAARVDPVEGATSAGGGLGGGDGGFVPVVLRPRQRGGRSVGRTRVGQGGRRGLAVDGVEPNDRVLDGGPARGPSQEAPAGGVARDVEGSGEGAADAVVYGLRFFTPAEVAAIHGLPPGWDELARRSAVQVRQQYGLLGNGLSTDVAAHLLCYLFAEDGEPEGVVEGAEEGAV